MQRQLSKCFVMMVVLILTMTGGIIQPVDVRADETHCGTIGTQTWSAASSVHMVTCDITVPTGVTLTIEAGAIIKFNPGTQITVDGKLVAQGTLAKPIYFTSYRDDTIGGDTDGVASAGAVGDWGNIQFNSSPAHSSTTAPSASA